MGMMLTADVFIRGAAAGIGRVGERNRRLWVRDGATDHGTTNFIFREAFQRVWLVRWGDLTISATSSAKSGIVTD